jgi:cytochrome P450
MVLHSAEVHAAIADAESGLAAYLDDLIAVRRTRPGDDFLSALLDVEPTAIASRETRSSTSNCSCSSPGTRRP